jgi:hypothetical protein
MHAEVADPTQTPAVPIFDKYTKFDSVTFHQGTWV